MKTLLIALIALSMTFITELSAQSYLDGCMLAYYPFTGNANDISGNNHNGTFMNGAALDADKCQIPNNACILSGNVNQDGSNIYVAIPNIINGLDELTISIWVKYSNITTTKYGEAFVSYGVLPKLGNTSTAIYYNAPNNTVDFTVRTDQGTFSCSTPFDQAWVDNFTHFAFSYNGSEIIGYVNGDYVADAAASGTVESINDYAGIGKHWWDNGNASSTRINGVFDELKVYECGVDEEGIRDIYLSYTNACLLGYYPFDGNGNDESGNGNDATLYGTGFTYDYFGMANSAYEVSGNTGCPGLNKFVELPNVVDGLDNLTISVWVKHNSYSCNSLYGEAYISYGTLPGGGTTSTSIYYSASSNRVYFILMTDQGIYSCYTNFNAAWVGNFQHFSLVYDGVNGVLKGYHNGILVGTNTNATGSIDAPGSYAALGKHWWAAGAGHSTRLNCVYDELKVWNCALDANQIQSIVYNPVVLRKAQDNIDLNETQISVEVYPNPFSSSVTFDFTNNGNLPHSIRILSSTGQLVKQVNEITDNSVVVDGSKFARGIYFYQLRNASGVVVSTGKLIVD